MLRPIYLLLFRVFGWKIEGRFPAGLRKYVIAIAPHTSNWDFLVGLAARSILRITHAKFLGKSQLFRPPFGWLFRALGGYPVDRSSRNEMVEQVAGIIKKHDDFILAIAPEGTRRKVERLRTGFYYIARAAGIPIIPVGFDYQRKIVLIGEPIFPLNPDDDFNTLLSFYKGVRGKNPESGIGG